MDLPEQIEPCAATSEQMHHLRQYLRWFEDAVETSGDPWNHTLQPMCLVGLFVDANPFGKLVNRVGSLRVVCTVRKLRCVTL